MHIIHMSPTIISTQNLRFVIHTNDHKPPHVHIIGVDAEAKISLKDIKVIKNTGFSSRDIKRILEFVKQHNDILTEAWSSYHE